MAQYKHIHHEVKRNAARIERCMNKGVIAYICRYLDGADVASLACVNWHFYERVQAQPDWQKRRRHHNAEVKVRQRVRREAEALLWDINQARYHCKPGKSTFVFGQKSLKDCYSPTTHVALFSVFSVLCFGALIAIPWVLLAASLLSLGYLALIWAVGMVVLCSGLGPLFRATEPCASPEPVRYRVMNL